MDERYPVYEGSDIIVESTDAPPRQMVERVAEAITSFLEETADNAAGASR